MIRFVGDLLDSKVKGLAGGGDVAGAVKFESLSHTEIEEATE